MFITSYFDYYSIKFLLPPLKKKKKKKKANKKLNF